MTIMVLSIRNKMKTRDFYYELDPSFIAQTPDEKRVNSKLMVLNRDNGAIEDKHFYDILDHLNEGDCLVLNNTKVIPARLHGHREGKEESIEVLLLKNVGSTSWETLVKPGRKMKIGTKIVFSDKLSAKVAGITDEGHRRLDFTYDGNFQDIIEDLGEMPVPPYISEKIKDKNDYQTVYAKIDGSVAAPTAGLHFSNELLNKIRDKGVKIAYLTLHVGYGTFKPVMVDTIEDHHMHSEIYEINDMASQTINDTIEEGGRIIAVGTTSVRTLESVYQRFGNIRACSGSTNIFIYPGFTFRVVDALITNFHLPESTLIMLVSAFSKREIILNAYEHAKDEKYRFFSFGDAMLIE